MGRTEREVLVGRPITTRAHMHHAKSGVVTILAVVVVATASYGAGRPGNADRCGLYDPQRGLFYPNGSLTDVLLLSPDGGVRFGPLGAIPLAGDFYATGHATYAAYVQSYTQDRTTYPGRLYRSASLYGGLPVIRDGETGLWYNSERPIVGDPLGQGFDEGWAVLVPWRFDSGLGFGDLGWIPLLGDWDGDGVDTPGLYDPAIGAFYFNRTWQYDDVLNPAGTMFGPVGNVVPITGDWDGDGLDTIGVFDQITNTFYYSDDLYGVTVVDPAGQTWGDFGWLPFCGDFDGPEQTVP